MIGPELIGFNSLNSFEMLRSSQIVHWYQIWFLAFFALFALPFFCAVCPLFFCSVCPPSFVLLCLLALLCLLSPFSLLCLLCSLSLLCCLLFCLNFFLLPPVLWPPLSFLSFHLLALSELTKLGLDHAKQFWFLVFELSFMCFTTKKTLQLVVFTIF